MVSSRKSSQRCGSLHAGVFRPLWIIPHYLPRIFILSNTARWGQASRLELEATRLCGKLSVQQIVALFFFFFYQACFPSRQELRSEGAYLRVVPFQAPYQMRICVSSHDFPIPLLDLTTESTSAPLIKMKR